MMPIDLRSLATPPEWPADSDDTRDLPVLLVLYDGRRVTSYWSTWVDWWSPEADESEFSGWVAIDTLAR